MITNDEKNKSNGGKTLEMMEKEKTDATDESLRLAASMMCMFLTTPNQDLRDRITKALICLLKGHIPVLIRLLKQFEKVDEPYLQERLYGVAFGCAIAEEDRDILGELAEEVYRIVFDEESVSSNAIRRDFAKSIIDYAFYRECEMTEVNRVKCRPPYQLIVS